MHWRTDSSGSTYCTWTICSGSACTTPSMARTASCAAKCQLGGAGTELVNGIQGSSPNGWTAPRKRKMKSGKRTPPGPITSSRSIEASGSSANAAQRAHAHSGQRERPHRCPCMAGALLSSRIRPSISIAPVTCIAGCGST